MKKLVWFIRRSNLAAIPGRSRRLPRPAEDLGYDHIVIYDHVLGAVHAGRAPRVEQALIKETDPFHEPLVTYATLAGVTKNLSGLTTGVIILPQRQTALFAKQAADVDLRLVDGRLRLGVGVGWNFLRVEFGTVSKCPDIFAAAAGGRSCRLP